MTNRISCYCAVALFICAIGHAAGADECDDMAAKVAKGAALHAGDRTNANFFPLSPTDGEYGVYLNCGGTNGLNLRFMSPPDPPKDWFQFVGRSASILTKVQPSILREGVKRCINEAAQSGQHFAENFEHGGARFFCDVDENNKRVELTITR
jgi:hypothetical protein